MVAYTRAQEYVRGLLMPSWPNGFGKSVSTRRDGKRGADSTDRAPFDALASAVGRSLDKLHPCLGS